MNGGGKSDSPIVPEKSSNKGRGSVPAERMEGRGLAKGNLVQQNKLRTQSRERLSHALDRVRQVVVPIGVSPLRHYLRQEPSAGNPHAGICAGGRSQERFLPRSSVRSESRYTNA